MASRKYRRGCRGGRRFGQCLATVDNGQMGTISVQLPLKLSVSMLAFVLADSGSCNFSCIRIRVYSSRV
uniref:Uncharacterized protein n=1 Tax=Anopheles minimus TaxID=112268 RepID=A0A182WCF7_9DIPT